jgi:hypothetical protein
LTMRAQARCFLGHPGWQDDVRHGLAMARNADPFSYTAAAGYIYGAGIPSGVMAVDDRTVREVEDVLRNAERCSDDLALNLANMMLGLALVHRHTDAERDRGQKILTEVRDMLLRVGHNSVVLPVVNVYLGREMARRGDHDDAIPLIRVAADQLIHEGRLLGWGTPATGVLVKTLLERGAHSDLVEAAAATERLAAVQTDDRLPVRDIWLLRLRALLAKARDDATAYADFRDRYRDMATALGFQGHIAWAAAMP